MRREYESWLRCQGYEENTVAAQLHRVWRVEEFYGDLDEHYEQDKLRELIQVLSHSTEDGRRGRPNPTKIPINGNIRNNLASYKNAVSRYARFRETVDRADYNPDLGPEGTWPLASASHGTPPKSQSRSTRTKSAIEPRAGAKTLIDFHLDGRAALQAIIAGSQYQTVGQAVASLTLLSHPQTVHQTGGKALFRTIRNQRRVGQFDVHEGRRILLDDNKSPTDAFLWANGLSRCGPDIQFNHVYAVSSDPDAYTALPNICMTPAFLAKLTDTSEEVKALLRYRSYQLYNWVPAGYDPPERPEDYETLEWAAPLPPVEDLRAAILAAMATKPRDRSVSAAREIGWLFGDV